VAEGDDPAELLARLELVLRRLVLCSTSPSARAAVDVVHRGRPTSMPPRATDDPAGAYAAQAERAGDDVVQLATILRKADHELAEVLRRPLAPTTTATLADLRVAIVDRGTGFTALEVAIALCTSEAVVRRRVCWPVATRNECRSSADRLGSR
jgi:hypothetical protein